MTIDWYSKVWKKSLETMMMLAYKMHMFLTLVIILPQTDNKFLHTVPQARLTLLLHTYLNCVFPVVILIFDQPLGETT